MNFASVEAVANAVLFEGYILYPYRPSAIKNRQRWNFGTLFPKAFAELQRPPERWQFSAQMLAQANESTRLSACVRYLQLGSPAQESGESWEEGFARSRTVENLTIADLCKGAESIFNLSGLSSEDLKSAPPSFCERARHGRLVIKAEQLHGDIYRLSAFFANESSVTGSDLCSHRSVQDKAFTSAHLLLGIENGAFVSLLEPPAQLEAEAKACVQDGVFPVLVGETGDRSRLLCSPIILYDYPQIAPESAGDFFDGTEMDEMLALRVLTLTDDEKAEMRRGDQHARAILERTEILPDEQLAKVHGAIRGLRPIAANSPLTPKEQGSIDLIDDPFDPFSECPRLENIRVFGVDLRKGDRVRLWPQKRADIMDIAMEGQVAIIEAIEQDFENNVQFAVVLEDDPGRDMGMLRQAGHRFFFSPEEIEPLGLEAS